MECLQDMLCVPCRKELGSSQEVLMCRGCKLWQHWKCTKGVSPSFYSQFYLAVVQQREPAHWQCQYCSKHQPTVHEQTSTDKGQRKISSLRIPFNPPSAEDSSDSNQEDELNMSFDLARTEREGPALYPATSLSSLEDRATPTACKVLISFRPVFLDRTPLPTTYSLCQEQSGQKVVKDCHGNIFETTGVIRDQAESYQCTRVGCQFQVRVCEILEEFLFGESSKEAHSHSLPTDSIDGSSDSICLPFLTATPYNKLTRPTEDSCDDTGDSIDDGSDSDNLPPYTVTPYNTPARPTKTNSPTRATKGNSPTRAIKLVFKKAGSHCNKPQKSSTNLCELSLFPILLPVDATPIQRSANIPARPGSGSGHSYCSDTTDGSDTGDLEPLAIHRFQPLTTPKIDKFTGNFSFSSSGSDSSSESLNITALCDRLADDDVQDTEDAPMPSLLPSPSDTIPACLSSDSEEEEEGDPVITYSVTEGTASGAQSKLTDSLGYTYQIKFKLGTRVFWTCKEKVGRCSATIIQQRKTQFTRGAASHNHKPNQSHTSIRTSSASTAAVSQSEAQYNKPAASQQRDIPTTDAPDCDESFNANDKMMPEKESTTTHQSKEAKIVKSTGSGQSEQKTTTLLAPVDNAPSYIIANKTLPATRSGSLSITFQEVATCTRQHYKPQSVLIDSEGFLYETKTEDRVKCHTEWSCRHKGPNGACAGKVHFNFIKAFNCDIELQDLFVWAVDHDGSNGVDIQCQPHNHKAEKTAAMTVKLKAMIHKQIFGYGDFNGSARDIIGVAITYLNDHEREHVPTHKQQVDRLKRFVWQQQRIIRDVPIPELRKYLMV